MALELVRTKDCFAGLTHRHIPFVFMVTPILLFSYSMDAKEQVQKYRIIVRETRESGRVWKRGDHAPLWMRKRERLEEKYQMVVGETLKEKIVSLWMRK